jgi:nitrate/nitrite-specific signal transduction histidine kinase
VRIRFTATIRQKHGGGSHYIIIPAERARWLADEIGLLSKSPKGTEVRVELEV